MDEEWERDGATGRVGTVLTYCIEITIDVDAYMDSGWLQTRLRRPFAMQLLPLQ
jgi:hypothetical protein